MTERTNATAFVMTVATMLVVAAVVAAITAGLTWALFGCRNPAPVHVTCAGYEHQAPAVVTCSGTNDNCAPTETEFAACIDKLDTATEQVRLCEAGACRKVNCNGHECDMKDCGVQDTCEAKLEALDAKYHLYPCKYCPGTGDDLR